MLLQPDFTRNPLDFINSKKNQQFREKLLRGGMNPDEITKILQRFYSYKVVLREQIARANNPEWLEARAWHKTLGKQYDKAVRSIEALLRDKSIPSTTRETIIEEDVKLLKDRRDFLTFNIKPGLKPMPCSSQQMIVFQSFALFRYLKQFKGTSTDKELYVFMAEFYRNFYKDTAINGITQNFTGEILKKNFIDNADKLTNYEKIEKAVKPFLNTKLR